MQVSITSRHGTVPDALKERAGIVLERLAKLATRPTHGTVTFTREGERASAEVILKPSRGEPLVGRAEAPNHRSALDRAAAKVRRQLDKPTSSRRHLAAGRK